MRARVTPCVTCAGQFETLLDPTPAMPAFPPEWDPERAQDNVSVADDRLTASIAVNSDSTRTVWSTAVYTRAALYMEMQVELHGRAGWMVYGVGNRNLGSLGKFIHTYLCMYVDVCVCVCIYIYIYIYIHTYIHTCIICIYIQI